MPVLTKVVKRRCERRGCELFLIPVHSGEVCRVANCGMPLAIKRSLKRSVPISGGIAALLCTFFIYFPGFKEPLVDPTPPKPVTDEESAPPRLPITTSNIVPQAAAANVSRGGAFASRGHYEDARIEFERAIEADPANPAAWANLGAANALAGRIDEARRAYDRALALAPDNWLAHYNLAVLLARRGDSNGAVNHFQKFFSLTGDREEERRAAIADLQKDPSMRKIVGDPRVRELINGKVEGIHP